MERLLLILLITTNTIVYGGNTKGAGRKPVVHHTVVKTLPPGSKGGNYIPIMAFVGLPQYQTTLARYKEMSATGITQSYCPFSDVNAMQTALDLAQKSGIKLFITCPELTSNTEATVKRFMNHPAVAGYFLSDEPGTKAFPALAVLVKKIRAIDDKHICYVNMLPNYAVSDQMGAPTYQAYVDTFIKEVPVQMLSFDNYPVIGTTNQSIRAGWYNNLEIVALGAKESHRPFWAFALSCAFAPYPLPTLATLRLQVYSDLAYGAQGIQYFTYWTLTDPGHNDYHEGPMAPDGKKTDSYAKIQQMNKEIQGLSGVFLGAKMISVAHTGNTIPVGTKPLTKLPKPIRSLKTQGLGAVVSFMQKNGSSYLVVVNRDFTAPMNLALVLASGVSKVVKNGSMVSLNAGNNIVNVGPGDVSIYKWSNKLN